MGEKTNAYKVLIEKLEGKRPLGIPGHIWKDIKIDPKRENWRVWTGFIHQAQDWDWC
jgi:hypothetical protein